MKKIIFLLVLITCSISFSQQIPEGWDKVILEGKVAYMNLLNGEITTTLPKSAVRKPVKVKEYEPTDIHYVKKGDTFSNIARKYNISLADLYKLNNLEDFDTLSIGQEVVVGYKGTSSSVNNNSFEQDTYSDSGEYHTVKGGETLYSISREYGMSLDALKSLNSLDSNTLSIGQKLRLR